MMRFFSDCQDIVAAAVCLKNLRIMLRIVLRIMLRIMLSIMLRIILRIMLIANLLYEKVRYKELYAMYFLYNYTFSKN